jgi:trehalose 6-phosphate synthase
VDRPFEPIDIRLDRLARHPRLALLADLDGTLIPFAPSVDEAVFDDDLAAQLRNLVELGVRLVIVTGRPRAHVDPLMALVPGAWWVAEHGAWRTEGRTWRGPSIDSGELDALVAKLDQLVAGFPGARLERKTLSACVHWRQVPEDRRPTLLTAAELLVDEWLEGQPEHERLSGVAMLEVRPRGNHKGVAVGWVRERLPDAAFLAIGDDLTDEDLFRALGPDDLAIMVGAPQPARQHADARVEDVAEARALIGWVATVRATPSRPPAPVREIVRPSAPAREAPFLVISNRTPAPTDGSRRREVGGLVAALEPALQARGGLWLGWSGQEGGAIELAVDAESRPVRATFDFPPHWRKLFYGGLCNRSLWPMLHGFPGRVRYAEDEWAQYVEANATYARLAAELVAPDATIWVHDYHLLLVGAALRQLGYRGAIGLFVHVPFPSREVFETFPWAAELVDGMLAYDLVGFHTARYVENFVAAARQCMQVYAKDGLVRHARGMTEVAALPIGIDADRFRPDAEVEACAEIAGLRAGLGDRRLLLGVDRLDYSKGVPERLEAFECLLERHPRWRRQVSMVQVSVPSRADVPEYAQLRDRVEHLVGRINGRFADADWVPVRYLYRSYSHDVLAQLYRAADVAVVTPLRDGMNLVAKEFVAAQDPARPGALVLSKFAGAAEELDAAILTNPFYCDGLADDLDRALSMPLDERRERHRRMLQTVLWTSSTGWADRFLETLELAHRRRLADAA